MLSQTPFSLPPYRRFLSCGAAALLVFSHGVALAQPARATAGNLTMQASIKQTGTGSSNPLMVTSGAKSLWGATTSPELVLKSATPLSQFDLDARIDESFFNQSAYSSTDAHATAGVSTKTKRWKAGVRGGVDYDTTRTSELTNYGLLPVLARHTGLSISPQITFNPTVVDALSLSGTATTSRYDSTTFTNYETFSLSPTYNHQFDALNTGVLSVQARRYQTTRNDAVRVDSWGPSIGWQTVLSERLSANAYIGAQTSRQYNYGIPADTWKWQYVFSGALSYKGKQNVLDLSVTREQFPYGNGAEGLQTSFSAAESHKLTPLVSFNLGAVYRTAEYLTTSTGNLKSYTDGHAGFSYRATEQIELSADYRYRYETLTNQTKTAQDNSFIISLVYRPNAWTLYP